MRIRRSITIYVAIPCIVMGLFFISSDNASAKIFNPSNGKILCCEESHYTINQGFQYKIKLDHPELKSKTHARFHSLGYTTLPILLARAMSIGFKPSDQTGSSLLLISTGIIIGPSGGSLYADDWNLAKKSILIRSVSAGVTVSGYLLKDAETTKYLGQVMQIAGGILLAGHALYDILILSAHSVDYYNLRVRMEAGLSMQNSIPDEWSKLSGRSIHNSLPEITVRLLF
ncbi:MAG: hypothetical protein WD267_02360 [Balneolales bacterium]